MSMRRARIDQQQHVGALTRHAVDAPDHAFRRQHGHPAPDHSLSAIDVDARDPEMRRGVHGDHARRNRLRGRGVAQPQQTLVTPALLGQAAHLHQFGPQLRFSRWSASFSARTPVSST